MGIYMSLNMLLEELATARALQKDPANWTNVFDLSLRILLQTAERARTPTTFATAGDMLRECTPMKP